MQNLTILAPIRGERGNPTRKDNAAHIVSHELETLRFVSLLLPPRVSVPKLYSILADPTDVVLSYFSI